jgi:hypothetical protein
MSARAKDEKRPAPAEEPAMPAAGPHAKPELTNPDLTPGTGMLPNAEEEGEGMQPSS